MNDVAIKVDSVCKTYKTRRAKKEGRGFETVSHCVLDNISFTIEKGQIVGIVGRNGAGKSTLLKILTDIIYPDSGKVEKNGDVASILELGMGFHGDLTGRENAELKCGMYGFSEKETASLMDSIIKFAELGEQIDDPLRTYSSGMSAKLAFAIVMNVQCDIMILDEILSVGDAGFRSRCKTLFRQKKLEGKTVIISSHSTKTLETMCDKVMWIDCGTIRMFGKAADVCTQYDDCLTNSFEIVKANAETGDSKSELRLGEMYHNGTDVDKNDELAIKWLNKAVESGENAAHIVLGDIYTLKGLQDLAKQHYLFAAEDGDINALMKAYRTESTASERSIVYNMVEKQIERGNVRAMTLLADALSDGTIDVPDKERAFALYRKAADCGDTDSFFKMGAMLQNGNGVKRDYLSAAECYKEAARRGHIPSMLSLATMYQKGLGVERDETVANSLLETAAHRGSLKAINSLLRNDETLDMNTKTYWIEQLSRHGLIEFELKLAETIESDYSSKDVSDALSLYKLASNSGFVKPMIQYASALRSAELISPNPNVALNLYNQCVEWGSAVAQFELGKMHLNGEGCEPNVDIAFRHFELAYANGNVGAGVYLAKMYSNGWGVEKNLEKAKEILINLSRAGSRTASINLSKLLI